jgi:phosphatidylserine/phosphatidylglycerophosphate/cardiolipin synthase-like enzyme
VKRRTIALCILAYTVLVGAPRAAAADVLCDPSHENCRTRLLELIRAETVGIDVAFWFMEDARYTTELIKRWQAGVPVRVLVDSRANGTYPLNANRLAELKNAGIPMREKFTSGILHWKMMLFSGQNTVEFSAANYSDWAFVPVAPYQNYIDEVIYFSDTASVVNSFRTKYDDLWTNTSSYRNYANITTTPGRSYPTFTKDPELNFPPNESYRNRAVRRYNDEDVGIDVIMYRITDRSHTDAIINATQRGIPVRLITEPEQYRDPTRLWHSWNVDRLYMAGVQIRHRAHLGLTHQKSVLLKEQQMTIFGSSNWTSPSSDSQDEHNYFTTRPDFYQYFTDNFERKWNNAAGFAETQPFVPLPPDRPIYVTPSNAAAGLPAASVTLTWYAGPWAHLYDVYFGTTPEPPLYAQNQELGPSQWSTDYRTFTVGGLLEGTTYYWRIVSKTMADQMTAGEVWSFTTQGTAPPPPPGGTLGAGDVLLYASRGTTSGGWTNVADGTAAGGSRLHHPDAGAAKISTALASPANYFELTFPAEAGKAYRLWLRGRAQNNYWANDSVHVQFSGSVNASGSPIWRIGTTSSTEVNLEDCSGCGLSGWGWQDNGWGVGVLGPLVYFATTGTHTIRVQSREDGFSIDQILLSPEKFLTSAPGALKDDATIYPESDGSGNPPPPPPPPPPPDGDPLEQVLYASTAAITGGAWRVAADPSAAGGSRIENPDAGGAKITTAFANPSSYVELTFQAEALTPYRLWIRGRAQSNYWGNDSVHVQFSSSVNASGSPVWRIGTTSSTEVNLEDCSGCGLSGWGWQDNGWGVNVFGPLVYFETSGTHTIRIQTREDGFSIDQIVLSAGAYLNSAPGALKNDATILQASGGGSSPPPDPEPDPELDPELDQVVYASKAAIVGAAWEVNADPTAADGALVRSLDNGAPKITTAMADPASYIEVTFQAQAETAYRLWIRARATDDFWGNDSVHVQFSGSVASNGDPVYRIGTTDAAVVNLEDCNGCGLSGWGWQDNGWGSGVLGPLVYFEASGAQTARIQTREDGLSIDQIVLSAATFVNDAPGALTNDATILPESGS